MCKEEIKLIPKPGQTQTEVNIPPAMHNSSAVCDI
jgi:hypothetical protein